CAQHGSHALLFYPRLFFGVFLGFDGFGEDFVAIFDSFYEFFEFLVQTLGLSFQTFWITAGIKMCLITFEQFPPFTCQRGERAKTLSLRGKRDPGSLHLFEPW